MTVQGMHFARFSAGRAVCFLDSVIEFGVRKAVTTSVIYRWVHLLRKPACWQGWGPSAQVGDRTAKRAENWPPMFPWNKSKVVMMA